MVFKKDEDATVTEIANPPMTCEISANESIKKIAILRKQKIHV